MKPIMKLGVALGLMLVVLIGCTTAFASTTHTVDEAINWCYAQIGKSIDMDGYPSGQPYQCVDLIKAYYQYLGVSPVGGNGADYAWNDLPSGWTRVQGGAPQRGDILVYGASSGNQYGHVAIFEDTRSTFHQNVEGNYVKRLTYAYNGFSNPYWGYIRPDFKSSAPNGVAEKLEKLNAKFPTGAHWNHIRTQNGDDADTLMATFNNSYSETVTSSGCANHNGVAAIGQADCNAFDGAIQCEGFARKIYYELFGQLISQQSGNKRYDIENIVHGDFIHLPGHSAVVLSAEGDSLVICEANYDIYGDGQHLCMINWGRRVSRSDVQYFYHASSWNDVQNGSASYATLDVNGMLDGSENGSVANYGTFDVYINGVLVSDDQSDFYETNLHVGATYEICDIRAVNGKLFNGVHSGSLKGTLSTTATDVRLSFSTVQSVGGNGIAEKLESLHAKFPTGMHWNHVRTQAGDDGDSLLNNFNNSYSDSITNYGCATHNGVAAIGQVDCNAFDGAIQCEGFARKIYYELFGQFISQQYNNKRYDKENIIHGDFIRLAGNPGHSAIVLSAEGDSLVIFEANYDIYGDGQHLCMINWGRRVSRSNVEYFYHASNWDEVQGTPTVNNNAALDVNGMLDGSESATVEGYGTFDVYVNGALVADDQTEYCVSNLPVGATYEIHDIRTANGKSYDGVHSGSLTGTLTASPTTVKLAFSSYGTLNVDFKVDGIDADSIDGIGTFDVVINGETMDAADAVSYSKSWPAGTRYEIKNIKTNEGVFYNGCTAGQLAGTVGNSETVVTLDFATKAPDAGEWRETDVLPEFVNPEQYEIEYKHTYKTTSQTSPGAEWTQTGEVITTYEDTGVPYYSDFPLNTSETVVYKGMYYYHFCGATTGNRVNFAYTDAYNVYHEAGETYMFDVLGEWADDDDPNYRAYKLRWNQGQWAGGNAICAEGRSDIWYIRYRYQNRVAVNSYVWTRTSGWETELDNTADSVRYRYRLKDTQQPVIAKVDVTTVTPNGYTLQCLADDDITISKIVFTCWAESESEAEAAVQEIVPVRSDAGYEVSLTVSITDHKNLRDCNYYTKIQAYDGVGNVVEYEGGVVCRYIPTLIHSTHKLVLPGNLVSIEESAFDGDIALGEIQIPDGVQRIASRAFADCARLVIAYVPDSVQDIDPTAFDGCPNVVLMCSADSKAAAFAQENSIPYLTAEE